MIEKSVFDHAASGNMDDMWRHGIASGTSLSEKTHQRGGAYLYSCERNTGEKKSVT
jgi:hypothetical protein